MLAIKDDSGRWKEWHVNESVPKIEGQVVTFQADGHELMTIEGLAGDAERLHPVQQAMHNHHGLQCGYCTPGILMTMTAFLKEHPSPTEDEVREALSGNLCRCTGYQNIVDAVLDAALTMRTSS